MTDTTDDIAEEISFQSFDDDCKLLDNLLHDVLQREVGSQFMEKLERTRVLAQVSLSLYSFFFFYSFVFFSLSRRRRRRCLVLCTADVFFSFGVWEMEESIHDMLDLRVRCFFLCSERRNLNHALDYGKIYARDFVDVDFSLSCPW